MPRIVLLPDGNTATLRTQDEVAVKHRRPLTVLAAKLGQERMEGIQAVVADGGDIASLGLSEDEMETVLRLNEASVWALLQAWSLDHPLPATAGDVGDMPAALYDVLVQEVARAETSGRVVTPDGEAVDGFSVDAVEVVDSPTVASGV